jgi:uncharacterized damage-inducible protein DinB
MAISKSLLPEFDHEMATTRSHLIHHLGQLSVYLRLNDIPVPSIYGPSADEGGFMDQTKTART